MGISRENVEIIIVMIAMGMLRESVASVHKVGGSTGWTILGNFDYKKWTSSDTFTAGDSLLSRRNFISCNATSAVATYTSGSDTVALPTPGHYYFLCGYPGHCQAGQKLQVLVVATTDSPSPDLSPTPSPTTRPSPSPSPATASDDSAQNGAVSTPFSMVLASAMSVIVVFFGGIVLY